MLFASPGFVLVEWEPGSSSLNSLREKMWYRVTDGRCSLLQLSGFIFPNYRLPRSLIVENEPRERFQLDCSSAGCLCRAGLSLLGGSHFPKIWGLCTAGTGGTGRASSLSSCSFSCWFLQRWLIRLFDGLSSYLISRVLSLDLNCLILGSVTGNVSTEPWLCNCCD